MSFCTIRDGLPGWPSGVRRQCEACEALERPRRSPCADPGPGTLRELVQSTGGLHAELRDLNRRIELAKDLADKWGDAAEGEHARQWLAMLRPELAHETERLNIWRRRLAQHPDLADLSVLTKCDCTPRDACLRVDWVAPAKVVPMRERQVGDDDDDDE